MTWLLWSGWMRHSTSLHAAARMVEAGRRRLVGFDGAYVAALEVGGEPGRHGCSSTAVFLLEQLGVSIGEARRRVGVAEAANARSGFSGEPLPARLPALAEAISAGQVSGEQAGVVVKVMDAVPAALPAQDVRLCEEQLVAAARVADPGRLAAFGLDLLARVDPDGTLRDHDHAHAVRGVSLRAHRGRAGGRLDGELDVELLEKAQTVLAALAKPLPEGPDGRPGQRTGPQRTHDALKAVFDLVLAGDQLPPSGGTPTTVVFHINADQMDGNDAHGTDRTVMATTDHGHLIPVPDAPTMADNAAIYQLVKDTRNVPLTLTRAARIATPANPSSWPPGTGAARSPAATAHQPGANATTSPPGPTAAKPTSTTSPCSAPTTIANSKNAAGAWS